MLALLAGLLVGTPGAAQICKGFESFQRRPVQLFAHDVLSSESRSYGAGVAVGSIGPFAAVEAGAIDVDAYSGAAAFTLGGAAGYQVPLNQLGTEQLCPTVDLAFVHGPKNINGTGTDFSETDFTLGITVGVDATPAGRRFAVIPTGGLAFGNSHSTLSGAAGSVSNSEAFGVVHFGVGFVFGHELSLTPVVSHPFGPSGTSTTFGITVAFAFGGHQPPVIANPATSCAGLANADSTVYDTLQVSERPRLRIVPERDYPRVQREAAIEGRVLLEVVVRPDGTPDQSSVRVVRSLDPALDRAALKWIRQASFWPACRDGRPVGARIAQPVDFCVVGCARGIP